MNFEIRKTYTTPNFKYSDGLFEMEGRSHPINPTGFYKRLTNFIELYSHSPKEKTKINICLEYLNSSSNRALLNVLLRFNLLFKEGYDVYLNWYYEGIDDIMYDFGTIFKSFVNFPFNLVEKSEA